MGKALVFAIWLGHVALEAAETIVRARRALAQLAGDGYPWRRPWNNGGGGGFWQGR